ncbi:MAG: hypothetical protein DMG71_06080 [Acidobacteria bacterium]|nr:MAG: hypothetical protein DMG71_06080 [Acidobacteriota bacterium]
MSEDQQKSAIIPGVVSSAWQRGRKQAARIPTKIWIVLWMFLIAAVLMALHTAFSDKSASLRLKVQHGFRSAQMTVWVDGEQAYTGKLTGSPKKKFGVLPTDSVQGNTSQVVPLSSGKHVIRVQVVAADGSEQEDSSSGDFVRNGERILAVAARRGSVFLTWQGDNTALTEASNTAWLGRYASTLFLTMAGSIISALSGFAIRELPGHIRARQVEAPKVESAAAGQ